MASKKITEELENKDNRVTVFLAPAANEDEDNFVLLSVNGVMLKVQRGVPVQIPKAYKEVLDNAKIANKVLADKMAKASKNA